ncbi:hypothetical protein [Metabacillus sp. 113a]|uniref:hypothetical protein n=1 Tax=Metabacillus sp. 113a TaxID=3404706 RepID=UPI003CEB9C66
MPGKDTWEGGGIVHCQAKLPISIKAYAGGEQSCNFHLKVFATDRRLWYDEGNVNVYTNFFGGLRKRLLTKEETSICSESH